MTTYTPSDNEETGEMEMLGPAEVIIPITMPIGTELPKEGEDGTTNR